MDDANYIDYLANTPLGNIRMTANEDAVISICFVEGKPISRKNDLTELAKKQLKQYFDGLLTEFELPMAPSGTDFQKRVWQALLGVPYGQTCSYKDIAERINKPKAVRAVGMANSKNPMTLVVPCHRVIGHNGALTGYASGLERKAWLLNHEAKKRI